MGIYYYCGTSSPPVTAVPITPNFVKAKAGYKTNENQ